MTSLFTRRHLYLFFCGSLALLIAAGVAHGQATARLTGIVKDQSGATVSGAAVTLTSEGTNASRTTATDDQGSYLFPLVGVGIYRLTVEHAGFKKNVQKGIVLEVNQNGRADVLLEVGQTTDVVEVSAAVPQVDTSGAVLGKVEDTRRIQDLPLVDRDTLQLGLLQAGVFAPDPDDGSGNPFSVSGQRSESLTFLVDGADNTDFLGNNIAVSPNPDAVAEFKILTNNYDAEFGRSSGGIVNQVIKSGTNQVHGTVFEFFRNDVLNARDFFLDQRASFKRNVFGGTVGAPIRKDKTFVFAAYQGARRREGQVSPILTVLSQNERSGDFGELCTLGGGTFDASGNCTGGTQLFVPGTNNAYPFNKIQPNPISLNYINKYLPLPPTIFKGQPNTSNNFIFASTAALNEDQGILRVDHNLTKRDALSFVYLVDELVDAFPFAIGKGASTGGNLPTGSGFTDTNRNQVGSLTWTHSFDRGWINEFRASVNRSASHSAVPTDRTSPQALGFTNVNPDDQAGTAPPIILTPTFNIGPSPQGPTLLRDMTYQYQDHLTIPHGRHEWKFGVDFRGVINNFNFDFFNNGSFKFGNASNATLNGTFTGDALADFVAGFAGNFSQFASAIYGIRTKSQYYYTQDTFKVKPRLTLVLGLRYEYNSPLRDIHSNILGFFGSNAQSKVFPNAPPGILYPGDPGTPNNALVNPDKNNFAPRVGFAWDMLGNAKLVMRGGFGIFYDIEDGALNLQFGGQPPFGDATNLNPTPSNVTSNSNFLTDPFTPLGFTNPYPFVAQGRLGQFFAPKISFAFVTDPNFRTPYSENYNYGFQYQLTKDTAVEAVYVGSLGRKLISSIDVNPPQPSIERQQLANPNNTNGSLNEDCARLLAGCADPTDPNSSLQNIGQLLTNKSTGISASHQFQLSLDRRFNHGVSFRSAYTLAKTTDLTSGFRSRSSTYTDPFNPRLDHGLADFDSTHRLVISASWELPIDRPFRNHRLTKKVTEGWQANVISSFQTGQPVTLYSNADASKQGNFLDRADLIGKIVKFNPRQTHSFTVANATCLGGDATNAHFFFDPTAVDCANIPLFTFGTLGRNTLRGPGINNWDISLLKKMKIKETMSLEFRAEMFNAFNHAQFLKPDNQGFSGTFGQVTETRGPRLVQFALKLYY